MLSTIEIQRLLTHVKALFYTLILPTVMPEGYILAADDEGNLYPDYVSTHHFVGLCLEIDQVTTSVLVKKAGDWFLKEWNDVDIKNPFKITTLAEAGRIGEDEARLIMEKIILPQQHPSGLVDIYAGFLDGGSLFSTLWAIKIMLLLSRVLSEPNKYEKEIQRAFAAVIRNWEDVHRNSFKGFYSELAIMAKRFMGIEIDIRQPIKEILASQSPEGIWDDNLFYTFYIVGNLISVYEENKETELIDAAEKSLRHIFQLEKEANKIPVLLEVSDNIYNKAPYLQLIIRALFSAVRYLKVIARLEVSKEIASLLAGEYPKLYYLVQQMRLELKRMEEQYGQIEQEFSYLESKVEPILRESPYERNVFIMMPLRQAKDERFADIERTIKRELGRAGYRGWVATDKQLSSQLWDNVAAYMIGCKYGIAVFTREEKETEISVREFNPNVSLELGFFLSRGKKVLILKDKILPKLPTDLMGQLYEEFDLNKVRSQLPGIIRRWVSSLEESSLEEKG